MTSSSCEGSEVPLWRSEDVGLLLGKGRYVDDIQLRGMLHVAFCGSPYAHATIQNINTEKAVLVPGVKAVLTARDLSAVLKQARLPIYFPEGLLPSELMPSVLALDEVRFAGEAVAMVIADSRQAAEDGVAEIEVAYDELPPVADALRGTKRGSPTAHKDSGSNIIKVMAVGYGDVGKGFSDAANVVRTKIHIHRGAGTPLETRGIVVGLDENFGTITVWSSTQIPHVLFHTLRQMLGVEDQRLRVIAPDVGGGFGTKAIVYPEEVAVAAAAVKLGSSLKWIEDRREHLQSAAQERDQFWDVEMAVDAEARILAVRGSLIQDMGAYAAAGLNLPQNSAISVPGPYVVPSYGLEVSAVVTNKPVAVPVRGAGYPQSCFVMERLLDRVAEKLELDPAEVRARNLIRPDQFPYVLPLINRSGRATIYDSGDFLACQNRILERSNYSSFESRRKAAAIQGRYIGIGMANGLKGTGRGPFEYARVRVSPSGKVYVSTGAVSIGTGIRTGLAQICARVLGVPFSNIEVATGDTAKAPYGIGVFSSRQLVVAGSAVHEAAILVRNKALEAASQVLEADPRDLELKGGFVQIAGVPDSGISLAQIADELRGVPGRAFIQGVEPGLDAQHMYRTDDLTYSFASHVCEVEVDVETGEVRILDYYALQDSGKIINPKLLKGQVVGGIVHGIGNALFESIGYDDQAQPFTTTLADYLLPAMGEIPCIHVITHETPSPNNPLGIKGVGEGGTVPAAAAIAAAVEDALREYHVEINVLPITPVRLLELIGTAPGRKH